MTKTEMLMSKSTGPGRSLRRQINQIGILTPQGILIECDSYEHLDLARELIDKISDAPTVYSSVDAEIYLQKLGYLIVRSRDVYGLVGYLDDDNRVIRMTKEQRKWLEDNYAEFPADKQRTVDNLFEHD